LQQEDVLQIKTVPEDFLIQHRAAKSVVNTAEGVKMKMNAQTVWQGSVLKKWTFLVLHQLFVHKFVGMEKDSNTSVMTGMLRTETDAIPDVSSRKDGHATQDRPHLHLFV
jgi:hypothetical protein